MALTVHYCGNAFAVRILLFFLMLFLLPRLFGHSNSGAYNGDTKEGFTMGRNVFEQPLTVAEMAEFIGRVESSHRRLDDLQSYVIWTAVVMMCCVALYFGVLSDSMSGLAAFLGAGWLVAMGVIFLLKYKREESRLAAILSDSGLHFNDEPLMSVATPTWMLSQASAKRAIEIIEKSNRDPGVMAYLKARQDDLRAFELVLLDKMVSLDEPKTAQRRLAEILAEQH